MYFITKLLNEPLDEYNWTSFAFSSLEIRHIRKLYDLWIPHEESDFQDQVGDLLMKLIWPKLFITHHISPHLPDTNLINPTDIFIRKQYLLSTFPKVNLEPHTMVLPFPTSVLVMILILLWSLSSLSPTLTTRGTSLLIQLQKREGNGRLRSNAI